MKSVLKWGLLGAALLLMVGCHPIRALKSRANSCHIKQPYMSAQSVPPLKVPAGLDTPDSTNALHIPDLKEPAPPRRSGKDPCLDEPPPFKVAKPTPPQA